MTSPSNGKSSAQASSAAARRATMRSPSAVSIACRESRGVWRSVMTPAKQPAPAAANHIRPDMIGAGCEKPAARSRASLRASATTSLLAVEVHLELVRGRAQPHRVDLLRPLVVDPGLDQVLGEHAALAEVSVVSLEVVEHRIE